MADFYQHTTIATLQKLRDRPVEEIEDELRLISLKRKMVLLLPALVTEFDTPSMPRIIDELTSVTYLNKIVLSLDRASWDQFEEVKKKMSVLPTEV
ncbi:MAG TPA: glycosyl transferase, partial [Deltaproteobacteria bacterium]|nr:glycosyl transferase [Deltaproteobacteria bacterium]